MNKETKFWNQGYYCACAVMLLQHDQPSMVEDCIKNNYIEFDRLKDYGIDEFDIEVLKPIFLEIQRTK